MTVVMIHAYIAPTTRHVVFPSVEIGKFPLDHDFGFDISVPALWYKYLRHEKINGKALQRYHKHNPIAYRVYLFGGLPKSEEGKTLFPGHDVCTGKKLHVATYGTITDTNKEFWIEQLKESKRLALED